MPLKPDWDLFRVQLGSIGLHTGLKLDSARREVEYRTIVSNAEHQEAMALSQAFGGEFINFLGESGGARLAPLGPTRDQLRVFNFMLDCVDDGSLQHTKTNGLVWHAAQLMPLLAQKYEANGYMGGQPPDSEWDLPYKKSVHATVRWGVREPFPHGFSFFGSMGLTNVSSINFMTFPFQPTTAAEAQSVLFMPDKGNDGSKNRVSVFSKGERIIIDREGEYKEEEVMITSQYNLIGAFDGQDTGRSYWVYGTNEEHNKTTVRPKVQERSLAFQRNER